jgi:sentrin-specific protease 1
LLNPGQWLNDEVINFYMALLQERADNDLVEVDGQKKKRRDIHCFNSHFYPKLEFDYAKSKVGRWTKKVRPRAPEQNDNLNLVRAANPPLASD